MTAGRSGATAVAGVVAVTVLLLVATWAAATGPDTVVHGVGRQVGSQYVPSPSASPGAGGAAQQPDAARPVRPRPAPAWVQALAVLLEALVAVVVLMLLWRAARGLLKAWRDRVRPPQRDREVVDFELAAVRRLAAALDDDAEQQRDLLRTGAPRNAIVACWVGFEAAAERGGVRRRAWQTPSEFVLEVLEQVGSDPSAVTQLAELYREARFSDHPMTEEHRARALDALVAAQRSWVTPQTSGRGPT